MNLTGRPIVNPTLCDCGCGKRSLAVTESGHAKGCSCRSCTGRRNRRKGQELERRAGKQLGGKPSPRSGAFGGGDIWLKDSLFADSWLFECKRRKKWPLFLSKAFEQAEAACLGTRKKPAIVFQEERGQPFVGMKLDDFLQYCRALSEAARKYEIDSQLRQIERSADAIRKLARGN